MKNIHLCETKKIQIEIHVKGVLATHLVYLLNGISRLTLVGLSDAFSD